MEAALPLAIGASAVGGLVSSGMSSDAATNAARIQAAAARNAADLQGRAAQYTANRLAPFADIGFGPNGLINQYEGSVLNVPRGVAEGLNPLTDSLAGATPFLAPNITPPNPFTTANNQPTIPGVFDFGAWGPGGAQSTLESTPGYQFTRDQGLRAVQNGEAAKGRGVSGNALTAAADYTTGLADKTFGEQFQRALTGQGIAFGQGITGQNLLLSGQQQAFGQGLTSEQAQADQAQQFYNTWLQSILGPQAQRYGQTVNNLTLPINTSLPGISLAQNAAAGQGNAGLAGATGAGNALTSGAAATAGGVIGSNNAITSGISGTSNALTNYALLNRLGFFGGGSTAGSNGLTNVSNTPNFPFYPGISA